VGSVVPDYNRLKRECAGTCLPSRWSGLETRADVGYAFWGFFGALAVVDAALWLVTFHRGSAPRYALSPASTGFALTF
jgi:hypothetical protein